MKFAHSSLPLPTLEEDSKQEMKIKSGQNGRSKPYNLATPLSHCPSYKSREWKDSHTHSHTHSHDHSHSHAHSHAHSHSHSHAHSHSLLL